ncbi:hypothetical protein KK141_09450 [Dyella sp. LX-66]|uniref:hypothetical protein n=1 Tax=unclassified Dyella TaxID=2634549 RepID=UPI001BE0533E|nr:MULTISPECIES: hypothetical protein [unclassified Dyella]MBT2117165.1 hypothetical protein [Dyella sp. LX-1]MBT2139759.1 hypothetical protein [Dyella sp. LX-66]
MSVIDYASWLWERESWQGMASAFPRAAGMIARVALHAVLDGLHFLLWARRHGFKR